MKETIFTIDGREVSEEEFMDRVAMYEPEDEEPYEEFECLCPLCQTEKAIDELTDIATDDDLDFIDKEIGIADKVYQLIEDLTGLDLLDMAD